MGEGNLVGGDADVTGRRGCRPWLDAVESVAAVAANERHGVASAARIGTAHARAQWEILDAAELFRVLLAKFAEFHQECKAFVALFFLRRTIE
jgi:hypothetical protein